MANSCAGLDPTWSHLPTPIHSHTAHAAGHYYSSSGWLPPAAAFENDVLTSALRASMAPAHAAAAAASPFSSPATPSTSSTSSASELLSGGHDAPAPSPGPPPARSLAGPKGGRVTKRKPRPSRRSQTTYITADPANFRRMVQEITGFPVASSGVQAAAAAASEHASATLTSWRPAPACVLPTLDTSAFLLDRAMTALVRPEDQSSSGGASSAVAVTAVEEEDSSVLQELEAMACAPAFASEFPTLESWGII